LKVLGRVLDLPIRRPALVLVAAAALTVGLAAGLPRLAIDATIESMIVADDPDHLAFERHKAVFGSDEVVSVAIDFGDALAPESLAVLRRIGERIEALEGVGEVDSLASTDDIFGRDDELVVEELVPAAREPLGLAPEELARIRDRVETNELWTGFLVSADRRTAALQVRFDEDVEVNHSALVGAIEAIAGEEAGGRAVHLAGHPFMKREIARTMSRDLAVFLPVTLVVMAGFLAVGVGSLRLAGILIVAIVGSVVWMLGLMGWVGQPLTALSNTAPTILLALGTAYFMHLAASYQKEAAAREPAGRTVARALARVRRPTVVAGVTTAIGFGSLATSRISLIEGFGFDLALGILAVVVIAIFAIPAALVLSAPKVHASVLARGVWLGRFLFRVTRFDVRHATSIAIAATVVLAGSLYLARELPVDSSGPRAFAEDSAFTRSSRFYRERLSGDVIENVYLRAPDEGGFKDPDRLRRMREFQRAAEALPQIDDSLSIADYIALMNRAMFENDPAEEKIPSTRDAVAQYLLLYSFSGDLDEFDDLVDPGYRDARIVLNATVLSSAESAALRRTLEELVLEYFPEEGSSYSVLSTEILLSKAADSLAREQVRSFGSALVLIVAVVALAFRSFWAGAHLLLPNGLPIALTMATMLALGMTLSESTSVIAVVALGIAVDSTVHLMAAIQAAERRHGSLQAGIVYAMQTTGRPVALTGGILVAGFSVLLLSDFRLISEFGGLTAVTILYCLAADLVVLPAQLISMRRVSAQGLPDAEPATLITGSGRAVPALVLESQPGKASLSLLGEEHTWRGWRVDAVQVDWLEGGSPGFGRVTGAEEVVTPILGVEWGNRGSGAKPEEGATGDGG
jgi:predicted RND superfamily exporter protein